MARLGKHLVPRSVRGWFSRHFHPLRLYIPGEKETLSRWRVFFAFAVMAAGLITTLAPERVDGSVLGDLSNGGSRSYVPTLCFLVGDLCLATGAWAAVVAARNRTLERPAVAGLGIVSAALTGNCVRQVWQILLLRDFYRPSLAFTSPARAAAVGWGGLLAIILTAGFLAPLLVAAANLLPRILVDALAPTRWLARCRWWLLLPFGALAATTVITQWVLPMSLAAAMGYIHPLSGASTVVPLRVLGTDAWTSLQILVALPLLLLMWDGTESARTCQRLIRTPKGDQTTLLSRVQRVDYRIVGAVTICGVTGFAIDEGSGLGALAGAVTLLIAALSLGGTLGRVARLSKGFERGVRRWQLPEEWRDVGRVSLLLSVLVFPVLVVVCFDVLIGVKNGLWIPFDLSKFYSYWQYSQIIGIPSFTVGAIFGHPETVIWTTCLIVAGLIFLSMLIQGFSEDIRDGFKAIWFMLRISLLAVALAPVMRMADHPYATFVLAGCAVLVSMLTSRAEERSAAVWSAIIIGGALTLYSLVIWDTAWMPAAAVLCLTVLQRFVYNAGSLNNPSPYRPNRVAYFQALPLLSVGMLALGHGAAPGYFDSEDLSTVSDHVALSVVAAVWLVMLIVRQTPRAVVQGSKAGGDGSGARDGDTEARPPESWAWLLKPHRKVVRFTGREDELAALLTWCEDEHAESLRLVVGPGGIGKTRLAAELEERLAQRDWRITWIPFGHEAAAVTAVRNVSPGRQLLVIDEAEARADLQLMLTALADGQDTGVRVLLLARYAGAWLDQLSTGSPGLRNQARLAREARVALPVAVTTAEPDDTLVANAVGSISRKFDLREQQTETRYKKSAGRQLILDLHAAALVATLTDASLAETGTGIVQADIRTTGLGQLLARERQFWADSARKLGLPASQNGADVRMLRQIIAVSCLFGAATAAEASALARRVPGFIPSDRVTDWLEHVSAAGHSRPDQARFIPLARLAELHTLAELASDQEFARACGTGLTRSQALHAVRFLARALVDYEEASALLLEILPDIADRITEPGPLAGTLAAVLNVLPCPHPALAPAAVAVIRQLLDLLPASEEPVQRAYWQTQLALRLAETGDLAGAAAAELEAAVTRGELAAADPDRHLPDLAASLDNVSARLSKLGNRRGALLTAVKAAAIHRELAAVNPGLYTFPLALSLDGLAQRYDESGHPADALKALEETVSAYRELAAVNLSQFRPGLARALSNVTFRYGKEGIPSRALPGAEEAVALYRKLAVADPARYRPRLAAELDNLGVYLFRAGRSADATPAAQEAVAIYGQLFEESPDQYRARLTRAQTNLWRHHSRS